MAVFFVENLTHPVSHSTQYPGVRLDSTDKPAAAKAYVATAAYGAQIGDTIRVHDASEIQWFVVAAQPNTANSGTAPTFPPVGG